MKKLGIVAGLLCVAALTGCAGAPTPAVTVTVTATVTAAPEPPPTAAPLLTLGESTELSMARVTVHAFDDNPAPDAPAPQNEGDKWAAIDVEACNISQEDGTISTIPWRLVSTDHRRFESSSIGYNQFPEPSYAWGDEPFRAGTCTRGWIVFVVNADASLTAVTYDNGRDPVVTWSL